MALRLLDPGLTTEGEIKDHVGGIPLPHGQLLNIRHKEPMWGSGAACLRVRRGVCDRMRAHVRVQSMAVSLWRRVEGLQLLCGCLGTWRTWVTVGVLCVGVRVCAGCVAGRCGSGIARMSTGHEAPV